MSAEKSQKTAIKESVRYCMVFAAMLLLLAALVVWNINSGSVRLPSSDFFFQPDRGPLCAGNFFRR